MPEERVLISVLGRQTSLHPLKQFQRSGLAGVWQDRTERLASCHVEIIKGASNVGFEKYLKICNRQLVL